MVIFAIFRVTILILPITPIKVLRLLTKFSAPDILPAHHPRLSFGFREPKDPETRKSPYRILAKLQKFINNYNKLKTTTVTQRNEEESKTTLELTP